MSFLPFSSFNHQSSSSLYKDPSLFDAQGCARLNGSLPTGDSYSLEDMNSFSFTNALQSRGLYDYPHSLSYSDFSAPSSSSSLYWGLPSPFPCQGHSVEFGSYDVSAPVYPSFDNCAPLDLSRSSAQRHDYFATSAPEISSTTATEQPIPGFGVALGQSADSLGAGKQEAIVVKRESCDTSQEVVAEKKHGGDAKRRKRKKASEQPESSAPVDGQVKRGRMTSRGGKREIPSQCSFCDRWFCSMWSRMSHERTHTGQNRHYCKVCHRSFPTAHDHHDNTGKSKKSPPNPNTD